MQHLRVAYVDTETTGLSAVADRIIEIAIVVADVDLGKGQIVRLIDEYQHLQDPGRPIPARATRINGISDAMVKGERIDSRKCRRLLGAADLCVAHNASFDLGFVAQLIPEAPAWTWGCSSREIPWKRWFPALANTKLQELCDHFRAGSGVGHRAMGDVESLMNLVSLPGLKGGRTFQYSLLRRKFDWEGCDPRRALAPDPKFHGM